MHEDLRRSLFSSGLRRLIRLPDRPSTNAPAGADAMGSRLAARSVRRREEEEDEDDEDEDEDDEPRPRKKRPRDDNDEADDEDEKLAKKAPAAKEKDKKKDKAKKKQPEAEEEEERERRVPKKGTKRYQMYVVGNGLKVLNAALIALFAVGGHASFHMVLFQLLEFDGPNGGTGGASFASLILLVILLCAMPVVFLVAEAMLFMTPARADARGPLIGAVTLQVLALVLALISFMASSLVSDEKLATRLHQFMVAGANFSFWVGFLLLMTYIKQLYYYLGDKPSGNSATTLGLFFVLVVAFGYGLFYAGWTLMSSIDWIYFILVPCWFLWDGGMSRCNILLMRNLKMIRDKIDNYIWPPDED